MYDKTSGNASVRMIGSVNIAPGTIAADTMDIAFPTIAFTPISAAGIGSASMKFP